MYRNWLVIKLLIAFALAACAGPVQIAPQPAPQVDLQVPETADGEASRAATQAPVPEPTAAATPLVMPEEAQPPEVFSTAPLTKAVLLASVIHEGEHSYLHAVDPTNGLDLARYEPISLEGWSFFTFSPDRLTLAGLVYPPEDFSSDGTVHLLDLQKWQVFPTEITFGKKEGRPRSMAFSPDGAGLVVGSDGFGHHYLTVVDLTNRTVVAQAEVPFAPLQLAFTSGGPPAIIAYGSTEEDRNPKSYAASFNLPDLSLAWELPLPEILDGGYADEGADYSEFVWWQPAVLFSPERDKLYIVHADEDKLTTVDFVSMTTSTVEIQPGLSWLEKLLARTAGVAQAKSIDGTTRAAVLSADGERLYVTGYKVDTSDSGNQGQVVLTLHGLQVIDVLKGTEIARIEAGVFKSSSSAGAMSYVYWGARELISLSPDGERLYLRGGTEEIVPQILDANTLEALSVVKGRWLAPALRLGGEPILLSTGSSHETGQTTLATFDPESLEPLHIWRLPGYAWWIGMP